MPVLPFRRGTQKNGPAKPLKQVHEDVVNGERIITSHDGLDFYHSKKGTTNYTRIDPRKYCPRAPPGLKEVVQPIPDYVYTKLPRMWAWDAEKEPGELDYLRTRYLREAMVFVSFRISLEIIAHVLTNLVIIGALSQA